MTLGTRIKEQRKLLGLTQPQLAEKINMSINSIKQLETDRVRPSLETLEKLCDLFGCSADYLLGLDENSPFITMSVLVDLFLKFEQEGSFKNQLLEIKEKNGELNLTRAQVNKLLSDYEEFIESHNPNKKGVD